VLRRNPDLGPEVPATETLPDAGGIDIDAAILAHIGRVISADAPQDWDRLSHPETPEDRRAAWRLWEEVQRAKETLSEADTATVRTPIGDHPVTLDRDLIEELARPTVDRIVAAALAALVAADVSATSVTATYLIGGAARIPLVATMLYRALGPVPTIVDRPLLLAEGALELTARPAASSAERAEPTAYATASGPGTRSGHETRPPVPRQATGGSGGSHRLPAAGHRDKPPAPRRQVVHRRAIGRSLAGALYPGRWMRLPAVRIVTVAVALVLASAAAATACTSLTSGHGARTGPLGTGPACDYKIAVLGGLSDVTGKAILNGARFAVEQHNAAHPTCPVGLAEFNTYNTTNRTYDRAFAQASRIVADTRILGVIGPTYNDESDVALPVLNQGKVPAITVSAPKRELSQRNFEVFHRMIAGDDDDAKAALRYLTRVVKVTRTFVVDDRSAVGANEATEAANGLGPALAGTASIEYPPPGTGTAPPDYTAVIDRIKVSKADSVFYTGYAHPGGIFIKQVRAALPNITISGTARLYDNTFIAEAGDAANGVYMTSPEVPPARIGRDFASQFAARFGENLPRYAPEAFDAVTMLASGIAAGKRTRADMLSWIDAYDRTGASRRVKFAFNGEPAAPQQVWSLRVVNGEFVAQTLIADA
jgi:branched-chain amino acid transport system substrate-binding protein